MTKNNNETPTESNTRPNLWLFWRQRRYIVTFMLMLGAAIMFSLRVNISVAIIPMTTNITDDDGNVLQMADFDWNSKEQGIILSSFFYGSILTQLPGGILSKRFNGARLYGIAIGVASLLTVITPFAAQHFYTMVGIRTIQGLFLGITFPTQMALIAKWAPISERATMTMFVNSGLYFGTVVALQFSGVISDYLGWRSVFYIFGALGLVWYGMWLIIIKETPEKDTRISEEEKRLILDSIGDQGKRDIQIPWVSIFTSVPMWAITAAHFTHCWLGYTLMTHMPMFFTQLMNIQMSKTGFFSCLPYLINGCVSVFAGLLADTLLSKEILSIVQTRKLFSCTAFFIQSSLLFGITFFMTPIASIIILTSTITMSSFAMTGFWINFIDIAPQFSGILFALSNTIATISGIIAPTLNGFIVQQGEMDEWKIVFYISASICLTGCIIYGLTADGKVQSWAKIPVNVEKLAIELEERNVMIANVDEKPKSLK